MLKKKTRQIKSRITEVELTTFHGYLMCYKWQGTTVMLDVTSKYFKLT